jgi:hypothetical protein
VKSLAAHLSIIYSEKKAKLKVSKKQSKAALIAYPVKMMRITIYGW